MRMAKKQILEEHGNKLIDYYSLKPKNEKKVKIQCAGLTFYNILQFWKKFSHKNTL